MKRTPVKKFSAFPHGVTIYYYGDGKGKTTAGVGVATRAVGYGWRVLFFQFFKSPDWPSGERSALKKLGIEVLTEGKGFVGILGDTKPRSVHKRAAESALLKAQKKIQSERFELVVLDEIISCVESGLLSETQVASFLDKVRRKGKGESVHLVLTGHVKYRKIEARSDLVTEMKVRKHPYYKGYLAIKGIDF